MKHLHVLYLDTDTCDYRHWLHLPLAHVDAVTVNTVLRILNAIDNTGTIHHVPLDNVKQWYINDKEQF